MDLRRRDKTAAWQSQPHTRQPRFQQTVAPSGSAAIADFGSSALTPPHFDSSANGAFSQAYFSQPYFGHSNQAEAVLPQRVELQHLHEKESEIASETLFVTSSGQVSAPQHAAKYPSSQREPARLSPPSPVVIKTVSRVNHVLATKAELATSRSPLPAGSLADEAASNSVYDVRRVDAPRASLASQAIKSVKTDAYSTISEVAEALDVPQHVLRFWETRFGQIRPMKRAGGRRFYRPEDVALLHAIRHLLYEQGYTIKGVKRLLSEQGGKAVIALAGGGTSRLLTVASTADKDDGDEGVQAQDYDAVQSAPFVDSDASSFVSAHVRTPVSSYGQILSKNVGLTYLPEASSAASPAQSAQNGACAPEAKLQQAQSYAGSPVSSLIHRLQNAVPLSTKKEIPVTMGQESVGDAHAASKPLETAHSGINNFAKVQATPRVSFYRSAGVQKIVPYDAVVTDEAQGFITLEPEGLSSLDHAAPKACQPQSLAAFKADAVQKLQAALYELMECQALLERDFML